VASERVLGHKWSSPDLSEKPDFMELAVDISIIKGQNNAN